MHALSAKENMDSKEDSDSSLYISNKYSNEQSQPLDHACSSNFHCASFLIQGVQLSCHALLVSHNRPACDYLHQ